MVVFTDAEKIKFAKVPRPAIYFIRQFLKGPFTCAEIGVHTAENAQNILQTLDIKKIYLIDPYSNYQNIQYYKNENFEKILGVATTKLQSFKEKIIWIRGASSASFSKIPNDLDFIYIDGNHTYPFVKQDIENYWPKIRKGGVLSGHDYYVDGHELGVTQAVNEFVSKNKLTLQLKTPDWWVVK